MVIDNKFRIGQTVYLKTDSGQEPRFVTAIQVNPYDVSYVLTCGSTSSQHYDFEISEEKNILVDAGIESSNSYGS